MPQLISKLQHNTYEKGEFSEEQPRDLAETIQIIKDFPWDAERPKTDIQLTGPSVTIQDEETNYLKLGLYFGGKFCVYYLDKDNHLYEYHAPNIDTASKLISDFFDHNMDLSAFEKHFFNIGNQPHFVTNTFEYKVKSWKLAFPVCFFFIYIGVMLTGVIGGGEGVRFVLYPILLILTVGGVFIAIFILKVYSNRHQYLRISKGNDQFLFGQNEGSIVVYNKSDIAKIIFYNTRGARNSNMLESTEVIFKDNRHLKFSNMLIGNYTFLSKFAEGLGISIDYQHGGLF